MADQRVSRRGLRATAASASWRPDFSLDPPITREQLRDPAYIHGSASASSPVQVPGLEFQPAVLLCKHLRMWQRASDRCQGLVCDAVRLQDRHGDIGLDAYMRLPVQHYYELDPGLIKPLGGSAFALKVPRVSVSLTFTPWACSLHIC